ncbi:MAG: AmpG family muropeptide MFS transporter, partial [Casimicrobiaceae bacterium]
NAGLWASVIGGLLGGLWMVKIGINRGLWIFGAVQWASILGFAVLAAAARPDRALLAFVIALEALGVGLGTAAFTAYIARATDPRYTATQFALFTSLAAVPRSLINATTGWIVDAIGWFDFYLLCAALALPGMALLLRVASWNAPLPRTQGASSAEV